MPDRGRDFEGEADPPEDDDGDIMAGDRRIARPDTALPDWYVSDTAYRPVPIVWFAGALIMQILAQPILFFTLHIGFGLSGLITFACAMLASGMIWHFTWERGMAEASTTWRVATIIMLLFFLTITAMGLGLLG